VAKSSWPAELGGEGGWLKGGDKSDMSE